MSTKCSYQVEGKPQKIGVLNGTPQFSERTRICGKNIDIFLRVDYSELAHWYARDGRYHDVFGFCELHGKKMSNPKKWVGDISCTLRGVRGTVKTVTVVNAADVADPIQMARNEQKTRLMTGCKSTIKRTMGQKNTESLTAQDWETIFREALDEFVVSQVMES